MKGFKLSDPILTATTVAELAKAETKDVQGWAGHLTAMVMEEEDPQNVTDGWKELNKRKDIPSAIFDTLRQSFAAKDALFAIDKKGNQMPMADVADVLTASLKTFGPRAQKQARKKKRK